MEEFRDIKGYEGMYQISDLGRVKSLKFGRESILKGGIDREYRNVTLSIKGEVKTFLVHQLVAVYFLNHKPNKWLIVVDHKDNDRSNNIKDNLQLITQRENASKDRKRKSKYVGVYKLKENRWYSQIRIKGKGVHLGMFNNETEAHNAYQTALKQLK